MLLRISISGLALYVLLRTIKMVYAKLTSPLRYMSGPQPRDWLTGSYAEVRGEIKGAVQEGWIEQNGPTMKLYGFFGTASVYTIDTRAVRHVLFNGHIYQKTTPARYFLERMTGRPGLTSAEGDVHKNQRKIMNPAFGYPQVRELTHIFVRKSIQLRNIWATEATENKGVARVDIHAWLYKVTLDIIGLAGFNRDINAVGTKPGDTPDEILTTFEKLLAVELGPLDFLQGSYPILRNINTRNERMRAGSRANMARIGLKILADSKHEIGESGTFETGRARDLLSLLVRGNTSKEIPKHQCTSDEDVLAQIITFLVAGHVTTSTAVTWILFALTQNVAAQAKLRAELLSLATENPTMDQLQDLPYLDCVVREGLRVHGPVPHNVREAFCDDILPLKTPWTDPHGNVHDSVRIKKGTEVFIPMQMMNLDPTIWGPDAREFIPERWEKGIKNDIPGVWGQVISFIGGPRGCVGFRFSLIEIKSLLFTLIRNFEFELAVPATDIGKKIVRVTQGPTLLSKPEEGLQLPMLVKPVVQAWL
ncbi:cytochrome P450 [Mycena galopus ATCC 62051]|nr:cytochrome P450 [Mycena galopus ATCC 62051]